MKNDNPVEAVDSLILALKGLSDVQKSMSENIRLMHNHINSNFKYLEAIEKRLSIIEGDYNVKRIFERH